MKFDRFDTTTDEANLVLSAYKYMRTNYLDFYKRFV